MEAIRELLTNRRGIAALVGIVVPLLSVFGVQIAPESIEPHLDAIAAGIAGVLALWSLARPKGV